MATRLTAYVVALIVGTTLIAGLIVGAQRDDEGPVDLIVLNGRVYTPNDEGAEAIAIQGNKILRVGTSREIQRLRRAQTRVVDARGGAVLPGFTDAHLHLLGGGLALGQVNLLDARTVRDVQRRLRAWAEAHPNRPWVVGRGWSSELFTGGLPTRHMLDEVLPDRPAYLMASDGRTGWANSAALSLAGITRRTPSPANGVIVKDPRSGEPTGVLREAAMGLLAARLPTPTPDEQRAAVQVAIREAHRRGVTSVHNAAGTSEELDLYDGLRREGTLDVRIYAALSLEPDATSADLDALDRVRAKYPDDPVLKAGAVALVVDEPDGRLAVDRLDAPGWSTGLASAAPPEQAILSQLVAELDRRGWQVMIHAAAEGSIRLALDAFEQATATASDPARERRHRIEHVTAPAPGDLPRFAALGVVASVQPLGDNVEPPAATLPPTRPPTPGPPSGWAYRGRLPGGGRLVFGSDWPAGRLDPLLALQRAVTRDRPDGRAMDRRGAGDRLTLQEAIDALTRQAAWASFDEHRKGVLARDMLADLVILSADILALPPSRAGEATIEMTIFDGRIVYQRTRETD